MVRDRDRGMVRDRDRGMVRDRDRGMVRGMVKVDWVTCRLSFSLRTDPWG